MLGTIIIIVFLSALCILWLTDDRGRMAWKNVFSAGAIPIGMVVIIGMLKYALIAVIVVVIIAVFLLMAVAKYTN